MVYLDNAASTPLAETALLALRVTAQEHFANPSSAHSLGAAAARALETARSQVAKLIRADTGSLTFTSGGTEANALAILGAARARKQQRKIVVSAIEHPSVLRNAERLEAEGFQIVVAPAGPNGVVDPDKILTRIEPGTALVALMLVNNELGTLQPVEFIARMLKQLPRPPHVHVDAVQAGPFTPIDVATLGADSLSLSAHKLHGPKGIGALWIRKGARVLPLWAGGDQESGQRSGTENLPGAVAFGEACAAVAADLHKEAARVTSLRNTFEQEACAKIPAAQPTVLATTPRSPHICSLRFTRLPAEPLLHALEAHGVFAAAGSACNSRSQGPSHVLKAIGVGEEDAVLRFSLSRMTTAKDIDSALLALNLAVTEIGNITDIRSGRKSR